MRDAHLAENIFQTRSSNNFKRRQEIHLISYIKGTVAYKGKDSVVIENHGIGYQIKVRMRRVSLRHRVSVPKVRRE